MFQCNLHPYKMCTFFDTNSSSLQCSQCLLPPEFQEQNQGIVDIDQITYAANSLLESFQQNKSHVDLEYFWVEIENIFNDSLENAQNCIQQAYFNLKEQARLQFDSLKKQNERQRQEVNKYNQAGKDLKNLLQTINKQSSLPQYIQLLKELKDTIESLNKNDHDHIGQFQSTNNQKRFTTQLDQQLLQFNDNLKQFCQLGELKLEQDEQSKNQDLDKTTRSQVVSRSMTSTSISKKMKKEPMNQVVKKELRCSLATEYQLTSVICCVALVIVGSQDGSLIVYDNESWEEIQCLRVHDDQVKVLCKQQGEQTFIASGSLDKKIKLFKREFNEDQAQFFLSEYSTLEGHHGAILDLLMVDDIRHKKFRTINILVSSSTDNTVRVWNYVSGDSLMTYSGHRMDVHALAFSSQLNVICSGSNDKTIRVWDAINFEVCRPLQKMISHTDSVLGLTILQEKQSILASCGLDKTIKLWDIKKGTLVKSFQTGSFMARIVQYQIGLVAVIGIDQNIDIWDYNITTLVHQLKGISKIQSIFIDDSIVYSVENKMLNQYH